jgi:uncharacterized protein (TIGR03437 family)
MPLPTSLGDVSATIVDYTGITTQLPLFCVSPTQINATIPTSVHNGMAQVLLTTPSGDVTTSVMVASVAPGLFSANQTGQNVAAAQVATKHSDGSQTIDYIFQCGAGAISCVPLGLDLSVGPTALVLYGTGIRNAAALSDVTVTIGGQTLPASFAGPTPGYAGLDQVNVLLPVSLAGTGIVNMSVSVGGAVSNVLTVSFGFATSAPACAGCAQYTNPPYTFWTLVSKPCDVSSVTQAASGTLFPPSSWAYVNSQTVYAQQATSANVDRLFIADVAADKTLTNQTCLSCNSPPLRR